MNSINPEYIPPREAIELTMDYIINFGREENPELPPQTVPIEKIIEFETQKDLWLGPGVDEIDLILAKEAAGILRIDYQNSTVIYIE